MDTQESQHTKLMQEQVWLTPQHIHAAVLFMDKRLNLTLCNDLSQRLLHTSQRVGQAFPLADCIPAETEEYQVLADMAVGGRELRDFVMRWEIDGRVRHVLVDSFREHSPHTGTAGICIVMKDIGNFTSVDQQVQRTEKLSTISKMAAGIAHEIRNPLTTVKGFMQILEDRFARSNMEVERQYADVMMMEMARIESLVSELLLLSTPHQVRAQVCPVAELIAAVRPEIEAQALLGGVAFHEEAAPGLQVEGNVELLRKAICNLAKNGIEAMEQGGSLRISARQSKQFVQIDISDTGPGIPYYMMDKIYDVFFTTKDKGIGLGLPIAEKVVAAHGGKIQVASKGFGTTFSMLLPAYGKVESGKDRLSHFRSV